LEFEYVYNAVYGTGDYSEKKQTISNLQNAELYDKTPFDANYLGSSDNTQAKLGYDFSVIAIDFSRFTISPKDGGKYYDPDLYDRLNRINNYARNQNNYKILNFADANDYDS